MKLLPILPAAALLIATGPVLAQVASPAIDATKAQLAASIGVDPNDYSLQQLSAMKCRLEGAHNEAEKQRLLVEFSDMSEPEPPTVEPDRSQLAATLGVNADDYTLEQLVLLKGLTESEDCAIPNPAAFARQGERLTPESAAAKSQLAEGLGLDPREVSLVELVRMHFEAEDND